MHEGAVVKEHSSTPGDKFLALVGATNTNNFESNALNAEQFEARTIQTNNTYARFQEGSGINAYPRPHLSSKDRIRWAEPAFDRVLSPLEIMSGSEDVRHKRAVFYGSKFNISLDVSCRYLNAIKNIFEKNNFITQLRINNHPDDDFVFMTKAKYFVTSGGAFSRYIGEFVRRNNGTVISDFISN